MATAIRAPLPMSQLLSWLNDIVCIKIVGCPCCLIHQPTVASHGRLPWPERRTPHSADARASTSASACATWNRNRVPPSCPAAHRTHAHAHARTPHTSRHAQPTPHNQESDTASTPYVASLNPTQLRTNPSQKTRPPLFFTSAFPHTLAAIAAHTRRRCPSRCTAAQSSANLWPAPPPPAQRRSVYS